MEFSTDSGGFFFGNGIIYRHTHASVITPTHRCQPSRNRAGNPAFGLFPAFPHFCENVPHFWLYFETIKIDENRNNFSCRPLRRHFVRKSSAKTSIITSPSYLIVILDSKIRLFRLSTSAPMDIHLVRVPQDVDVVNVR